jgi:hypothetical protein
MSDIDDLAEGVRALALSAGMMSGSLAWAPARLMDLAGTVHRMATQADDPYVLHSAAAALETASRSVASACHYAADTQRRGIEYASHLVVGPSGSDGQLPVSAADIEARTTENRIRLADDVADVLVTPDFGGYLDVVMHGDAEGAEADICGHRVPFSLEQVVAMVQQSPSWGHRPVRLMSCSTGQAAYAKELADRLGVPVYAPSDVLKVAGGVKVVLNGGVWRRFEPGV